MKDNAKLSVLSEAVQLTVIGDEMNKCLIIPLGWLMLLASSCLGDKSPVGPIIVDHMVQFGLDVCSTSVIDKPNIVVIYADDMGYGDCTVNNPDSKIPTPNIDRLAKEGLRFTDAHSPHSTCTASCYGILTGTCPVRTGVVNSLTGHGPVIDDGEVTISDFLKDQGYVTRMIGKWHLGFDLHVELPRGKTFDFSKPLTGGPMDCGFDSYFGVNKSIGGPPYFLIRDRAPVAKPTDTTPGTKKDLKTNGKNPRTAYSPGDIAPGFVPEAINAKFCDEAVKIINDHAAADDGKPLFLYYAMLEPHTPLLPTAKFIGKSGAGVYGDYIVQLDYEVGRVLAALKESGLEKDTLVIFSSDNGAMWRPQDIERFGHQANGNFSGTKGTAFEGGHRVPFIVRQPGRIPASQVCDALINHTDLFATLADLFNVDLATTYPNMARDSYSFLDTLTSPDASHHRPDMIVTSGSYRLGNWKLLFKRGGGRSATPAISHATLHNLSSDPAEQVDLSDAHAEMKSRLFAKYQQFMADRTLKPLAVAVAEWKQSRADRSKRPAKPHPTAKREDSKDDVELSPTQYRQRISQLRKQLDDLLTDQQKQARDAARQQAIADGKGGVRLRKAMDEALKLTPSQQPQFERLRTQIRDMTRKLREANE